jgi:membrane fusion protein (multidrug efflux system)
MPDNFSRTFRSLDAETEGRARLTMVGAALILGAWGAWFFLAKLSVYVTSDTARLEVRRATHPIDAPVAGRVVKLNVELDQEIHEGDILVELDPETQQLDLAEARAKAGGLGPQVAAIRQQIAAEERALTDLERQSHAAIDEVKSRVKEAQIAARLSLQEAERLEKLHKSGSIAEIEAIRARGEADKQAAVVSALRAQLIKLQHEFHTSRDDRRTRVAGLAREASRLDADLGSLTANIDTLGHSIERRRIRAPASGKIGEIGTVRLGSVVREGDRIGTIVARGDLRMVAELPPAQALGRVRPGQSARVRFDGFPWTEFGDVTATVTDVASEVRNDHARVDLAIVATSGRIPLQHGLPGSVEIEIERASPASLVLRAAGQVVARSKPNTPLPPPSPPSTAGLK